MEGIFNHSFSESEDECAYSGIHKTSISLYSQSNPKESKSNSEPAKVIAQTGSRNRPSTDRTPSDQSIKTIYSSDNKAGNEGIFTIRNNSKWYDARRQHVAVSKDSIREMFSDDDSANGKKIQPYGNNKLLNTVSSEQSRNAKIDFKTLFMMFLKRSSIYALNQVGNSYTTRRKIFWALIMILGLIGSSYQIIEYLCAYFSYPVVVNMDSVSSLSQEFPAVTVCNINSVRKEFLGCLIKKIDHKNCTTSDHVLSDDDISNELVPFDEDDKTDCDENMPNISRSYAERFLWQNFYSLINDESQIAYGHQREDFIRSCSFNGEKCTANDFILFVNDQYGNCFTFNAANETKQPLNTSFVGPNGGLEVELDLEVDKYAYFTSSVGARAQVHDPYHSADVTLKGINVSPGFETSIALSKYQMMRLEKPFKDECEEYPVGQSMQTCRSKCLDDHIYSGCNCVMSDYYNGIKKKTRCDFSKVVDLCCVIREAKDVDCSCPLACKDTEYQSNIFSAVWPSDAYNEANPVKNAIGGYQMSTDAIRRTRLKLKVYYDTLETSIYQQKAMYQSSELFSQIGGQMGLWLGLSLVAVFECVENFIVLWQYRAKHSAQHKN